MDKDHHLDSASAGAIPQDYGDPVVNSACVDDILFYRPDVIEYLPRGILFTYEVSVARHQIAFITKWKRLGYMMTFDREAHPAFGRCATNVTVWKSHVDGSGLTDQVFAFLFNTYDTVISDTGLMSRGLEYWQSLLGGHGDTHRVGVLFRHRTHVYDCKTSMGRWLPTIGGWRELDGHEHRRFFLSTLTAETIAARLAETDAASS